LGFSIFIWLLALNKILLFHQRIHNPKQSDKATPAYTPANKSSARMPHPWGNFSSLRIGQGLTISKNLNNRKPPIVAAKTGGFVSAHVKTKVRDWPANSSATTSGGSVLPVTAIEAGAYLTQMTEPTSTKITMKMDMKTGDRLKCRIRAKTTTGGSDPHVPGAIGSQPRPKQDANNLFII